MIDDVDCARPVDNGGTIGRGTLSPRAVPKGGLRADGHSTHMIEGKLFHFGQSLIG
ncbi:MAG TPA: hypothetical protein VF881_03505 [Polyangiaceae bacterium]